MNLYKLKYLFRGALVLASVVIQIPCRVIVPMFSLLKSKPWVGNARLHRAGIVVCPLGRLKLPLNYIRWMLEIVCPTKARSLIPTISCIQNTSKVYP